ncbi:MAG TPA: hypothetical protein VGO63_02780 [Candidatus Paceibacterota bacterium]|jgi:hypothetical protein|nr:hypothetical protein [Candidatus Paceibacterota bacterium]
MKPKISLYSGIRVAIIAILVFVFPFQGNAAISPSAISVDLSPQSPSAGENTTITLSSYATSLDSISISWFVNGKKVSSEIGGKSFTVAAPAVGSTTTVRVVLAFPDGELEKKVVISPAVMVLLYEATDSHVPPFYRGKALPTADSEIKVVAMPEIKNASGIVSPKNIVYAWKKNYTNDAEGSGYGKNFFTFTNDYLENGDTVSVTASTTDGQRSLEASLDIRVSQPQISFYKNDAILGTIWEQALKGGHKILGDEIIVAEPYFISPKELRSPSLVWNWFINGNLTNNILDYRKNWLPVKVESGVSGVSTLSLELENNEQLLGTASKQINVEF